MSGLLLTLQVINCQQIMAVTKAFFLLGLVTIVNGHGRLIDPPSRSSAFRFGFNTPPNFLLDKQLNCGGVWNQWQVNHGRCGVCGDPYQGPRKNEAGGVYATGTIVHRYQEGTQINVVIDITAPHGGWSEFRICPNNNIHKAVTQECLDRYLLATPSGETRYIHQHKAANITIPLVLPKGLTCSQCVLQWKWNTAHDYNCDTVTKECCKGCGPQEQFYGCADVEIVSTSSGEISSTTKTTRLPNEPAGFIPIGNNFP